MEHLPSELLVPTWFLCSCINKGDEGQDDVNNKKAYDCHCNGFIERRGLRTIINIKCWNSNQRKPAKKVDKVLSNLSR